MGPDAESVGAEVRRRRDAGERVAGFVGGDEALARAMAEEMLGPIDHVVVLSAPREGTRDRPGGDRGAAAG